MTASSYRTSVILADTTKGVAQLIASGARPPLVKVHNNVGHVQMLHDHLGDDTIIILRMIGAESIVVQDEAPAMRAVQFCEALKPVFDAVPYAYVEAGPPLMPVDDWSGEFWVACMSWAHARGYKLCVMTIGEGNPELPSSGHDGMAPMWPVVQLAASYGFLLGPQAYWVDGSMDPNDDWHMFRIYRAFRDYPGRFPPGTRIAFTECGIDLRNGLGWRTALGGDWHRYRAGQRLLSSEIKRRPCPPGAQVIGGTVFALHENDLWRDFNYLEHFQDQLDDIKAEQSVIEIPPLPEPIPVEIGVKTVLVSSQWGCNHRVSPSMNSIQLGYITQGTRLIVEYPPVNQYVRVLDKGYVYAPNLTIIGE